MSTDFATAKAFLSRNEGGNSVFNHLSNLLFKLAAENPDDALRAFAAHSGTVKQSTFIPGAGEGQATLGQGVEAANDAAAAWAAASTALYRRPTKSTAAAVRVSYLSPAVASLEWAGVGVDAEEAHRIDRALDALAAVADVKALRFWGRIQGTGADYYVAEGLPRTYASTADSPSEEAGPVGANRFTYWVAHSIGGAESWTKLQSVTTAQLASVPLLRRYLTGSLDAPVGGHPAFPGTEAAYLRAVIGHITANTAVAPEGTFVAGEGDPDAEFRSQENAITDPEEPAEADLDNLAAPGGWNHYVAGINAAGRVKNYVPRVYDEDEKAWQPNPNEDAPEEVPAIREVDAGEEENPNWVASGAGQQRALKSLAWPGAVAVASATSFTNYYSGFGVPRPSAKQYVPKFPGNLSVEFEVGELREAADTTLKPPDPVKEEAEEGEEEDD